MNIMNEKLLAELLTFNKTISNFVYHTNYAFHVASFIHVNNHCFSVQLTLFFLYSQHPRSSPGILPRNPLDKIDGHPTAIVCPHTRKHKLPASISLAGPHSLQHHSTCSVSPGMAGCKSYFTYLIAI